MSLLTPSSLPSSAPYSVLIIEDHPLFLKGVKQLLDSTDQFEVLADADTAEGGVQLVLSLTPDLVLLDINLGQQSGLDVLSKLKQTQFSGRIVMLTVSSDTEDIRQALTQGADGYLLKDMDPQELLGKLERCMNHQPITVLDESVATAVVEMLKNSHQVALIARVSFSERESQVVIHIAAGKSNKLIARAMNISNGTVKVHVKNILRKLNLSSRIEVAIWAADHGY